MRQGNHRSVIIVELLFMEEGESFEETVNQTTFCGKANWGSGTELGFVHV